MVDVRVEETNGVALVSLSGELDISQVREVENQLKNIEERRPEVLLLDLRGLDFLDSSGLRLVLEADLRSRRDARRFAVVRGPDQVHRVFLIALLDKRLEFIDDPSALGALSEDGA